MSNWIGAHVEMGIEGFWYLGRDVLEIVSVFYPILDLLDMGELGTDRGAVWYEEITNDENKTRGHDDRGSLICIPLFTNTFLPSFVPVVLLCVAV